MEVGRVRGSQKSWFGIDSLAEWPSSGHELLSGALQSSGED